MPTTREEMLIEEWKDIRETLRYFGNKRFAQLTVFIAINAFMFDAFFKDTVNPHRLAIAVAGALGALIFCSMELGSVAFWKRAAQRGEDIEKDATIPLRLFTSHRPKESVLSATFATYAIYGLIAALWGFVFVKSEPKSQDPAATLVEHVLKDAPGWSGRQGSQWSLREMKWDPASSSYIFTVVESGSGKAMIVTVDPATGKNIKTVLP